jgi:SAM-dependent methyltransferase
VIALAAGVTACGAAVNYTPTSGQPGKDMVWVPTPEDTVEMMLNLAGITPSDYVIDLGSGDGRFVIAAAQRGARALGIEYNGDLVRLSRERARQAGVSRRAQFREADIFKTDFSQATVLTLFMLPDLMLKIRPQILAMRPGTRIVSNTFEIGGDEFGNEEPAWEPDETRRVTTDCASWCVGHLWIVPARVDGSWNLHGTILTLTQQFQMLSGTMGQAPVTGRVRGTSVTFFVGTRSYTGTLSPDGTTLAGIDFTATRIR